MESRLTEAEKSGLYLVSGSTHPELAEDVADFMDVPLGGVERRGFADGERYVRYTESVRGKHVAIIQSQAQRLKEGWSIDSSVTELELMADAALGASAREVTAVIPHFAYARQDRKNKGREPVSATLRLRLLAAAGVNRIVFIDIHSPQIGGAFGTGSGTRPVDQLTAEPYIRREIRKRVATDPNDSVIVAPDAGRAKESEHLGSHLKLPFIILPKIRSDSDSSEIFRPEKPRGVYGKTCYIFDDMIDTGGTHVSAAEDLKEAGADRIVLAATHGLFSGPAFERIQNSCIDELIVTDTVPQDEAKEMLGKRLHVVSMAHLIGSALIQNLKQEGSVSSIFAEQKYY